jgi:hypothetical protein
MYKFKTEYFKVIFLFLISLFQENLYSQETTYKTADSNYWVDLEIGSSSAGFAEGLGISYQTNNRLISVRVISNSKYGESIGGGNTTPESILDVGALYGLISKRPFGYVSISAGLGLVSGKIHGEYLGNINWINTYEEKKVLTFGIPLEAQFFLTPFRRVGVGVSAFADLNPKRTFGGMMLCLQIGKLH